MDLIREESMTSMDYGVEKDLGSLGRPASARPMFPRRSAGSWPSCPGGSRRAPVC